MKRIFILLALLFSFFENYAQDAIITDDDSVNTANPAAILDVFSKKKGFLPPRMTKKQREAIETDENPQPVGLIVYQTDQEKGLYLYDGKKWLRLVEDQSVWKLGGNANLSPKNNLNLIGSQDTIPISFGVNGQPLISLTKNGALDFLTANISIGKNAGQKNKGTHNIHIGNFAGENRKKGFNNTDIGHNAGLEAITSSENTNVGYSAGKRNLGNSNTVVGTWAGGNNKTGSNNTFLGNSAGYDNNGSGNVFLGNEAGAKMTTASNMLIIANTDTENPLISGDFKKAELRVGGNLLIKGNMLEINGVTYLFTAAQGTANTFLKNDGNGNLTWANPSTSGSFWALGGNDLPKFSTAYIGTNTPNDLVFKVNTKERMRLDQSGRLSLGQDGNIVIGEDSVSRLDFSDIYVQKYPSIYFGKNAGKNAKKANDNIGIGYQALSLNIDGAGNVVLGNNAGQFNTASVGNVLIGNQSGMKNQGNENVIIGHQAGSTETNLNSTLIIANNEKTELLRGSFEKGKEFLSVNGIVVIGKSNAVPANGALKYEGDSLSVYIDGKWNRLLIDQSAFVLRDGSLPLTGNWNVEKGLDNADYLKVRNDINAGGFITADKGIRTTLLQLKDDYTAEFITIKINSASQHNEIPSSKAVVDFVSTYVSQNNATINPLIFSSIAQDYLRQDGTTPLKGDWNVGNKGINNIGDLQSNGIIRSPQINAQNLILNGRMINTISTTISANPNQEQIPTSRAVFDFVSANNAFMSSYFVSANQNYVKIDGSTPLTANWNVGMGFQSVAFVSVHGNAHLNGFTSVNQLHTHTLQFATSSYAVTLITAQISSSSTNSELVTTKGVYDFVSSTLYMVSANPNVILQGGNTFGTDVVIGSNDTKNLILKAKDAQILFTTNGGLNIISENLFIGRGAGWNTDLTTVTMPNTFIGTRAGRDNTSGQANHFVGYQAGISNTTGSSNHFSGYDVGYRNTTGSLNCFIGYWTGTMNTTGSINHFVGILAGNANQTGTFNHFEGFRAGRNNTIGSSNYFSGQDAGFNNTDGSQNHFSGYFAGYSNKGNNNYYSGFQAGRANINGNNNLFIGFQAGYSNINGSDNLFIGYQAGYFVTASNKLHIANNATESLIEGDFLLRFVTINGSLQVTNLTTGFVSVSGGVLVDSDLRYKNNIQPLENALEKILQISGYNYNYKTAEFPTKNFPEKKQIGVIAQEVEKVLPELVATDANGYKSVDYAKLTPVLIDGIKAQQKQIEAQNQEIQLLKQQLKNQDEKIQKIMDLLQK